MLVPYTLKYKQEHTTTTRAKKYPSNTRCFPVVVVVVVVVVAIPKAARIANEKTKEAQDLYEKEMAEREKNKGRKIGDLYSDYCD